MESQDQSEVDRIKANVEQCRKTLQSLGYADFTFEDFFAVNFLSALLHCIIGSFISSNFSSGYLILSRATGFMRKLFLFEHGLTVYR